LSNFVLFIHTTIYQLLQVIKLDYSTRQEDSRAFGKVDIPEEQSLKERQVNTQEVLGWSYRPIDKERRVIRRKYWNYIPQQPEDHSIPYRYCV
jgi:hypothetical protein